MDKNGIDQIVPFGKYKNQPIEAMAQDSQYTEWLMNQDWFRSRFPELRTIIVNNFREPSDTPEHNSMVARFIDDGFCENIIIEFSKLSKKEYWREGKITGINNIIRKFESKYGSDICIQCYFLTENGNNGYLHLEIECKPVMSDDFPSIMRQCRDQKTNILVIGEYTGVGTSLENVRKMFPDIMIYEMNKK